MLLLAAADSPRRLRISENPAYLPARRACQARFVERACHDNLRFRRLIVLTDQAEFVPIRA